MPRAELESWALSGNELSLALNVDSLQDLNKLVQVLQDDELVDYCTVSSANSVEMKNEDETTYEIVKARVLVYLCGQTEQ